MPHNSGYYVPDVCAFLLLFSVVGGWGEQLCGQVSARPLDQAPLPVPLRSHFQPLLLAQRYAGSWLSLVVVVSIPVVVPVHLVNCWILTPPIERAEILEFALVDSVLLGQFPHSIR